MLAAGAKDPERGARVGVPPFSALKVRSRSVLMRLDNGSFELLAHIQRLQSRAARDDSELVIAIGTSDKDTT